MARRSAPKIFATPGGPIRAHGSVVPFGPAYAKPARLINVFQEWSSEVCERRKSLALSRARGATRGKRADGDESREEGRQGREGGRRKRSLANTTEGSIRESAGASLPALFNWPD